MGDDDLGSGGDDVLFSLSSAAGAFAAGTGPRAPGRASGDAAVPGAGTGTGTVQDAGAEPGSATVLGAAAGSGSASVLDTAAEPGSTTVLGAAIVPGSAAVSGSVSVDDAGQCPVPPRPARAQGARGTRGARSYRRARGVVGSEAGPRVRESVAVRAGVDADCEAAGVLRSVWDLAAAEGRAHAALLRECVRVLEVVPQGPHQSGQSWCVEEAEYALAQAMRCTIGGAGYVLEDARRAVHHFPRTLALLEDGELPLRWHRRMLRHCTGLSEESCRVLDEIVAGWDLRIGEDSFRRRLSLEVRRLRDLEDAAEETPVPERTVSIAPANTDDGSACLMVQGPAPEILSLGHRLDAAARAVRTAQRDALATGEIVPFDDGSVTATGQALSLGRLRYEVLTRSVLETGGIEVPTERFRLSVTVPALTLLGRSEAPGTPEGTVPLPAVMAREFAGREETWYRILTDPVTGAFLPLPARRYAPSVSMLEHLRNRNPVCAVPGCGRGVRHGAEADHIIPFDHDHPEAGGRTEIENLHLLCRRHHQMKTAGILRPTRTPTPDTAAHAGAAASAGNGSTPGDRLPRDARGQR